MGSARAMRWLRWAVLSVIALLAVIYFAAEEPVAVRFARTPAGASSRAAVSTPAALRGRIEGVVHAPDGTGTAGALVVADSERQHLSTSTDASGRFAFDALLPGKHTVSVNLESGLAGSAEALVREGAVEQVDLILAQPSDAELVEGHVSDSSGGPIVDALVRFTMEGDERSFAIRSKNDGRFALSLPVGRFTLWVHATGYADRRSIFIHAAPRRLEITLDPESTVRGVVVDRGNRPVEGAIVRGEHSEEILGEEFSAETTTDASGRFELRGLDSATFSVEAKSPVGHAIVRNFVVPPASLRELRIVLLPVASLEVSVRTPTGAPLPRAKVKVESVESFPAHMRTDPDGRATFVGLAPGLSKVTACAEGFMCHVEVVALTPSVRSRLEVELELGTTVVVHVTDRNGRPVERAVVTNPRGGSEQCWTNQRGDCELALIGQGTLVVVAIHPKLGVGWEGIDWKPTDRILSCAITLHSAVFTGRVRWDDGTPAAGVPVQSFTEGYEVTTDSLGRYELRVAPGEDTIVRTSAPPLSRTWTKHAGMQELRVSVPSGVDRFEAPDMVLPRSSKAIRGRVVDPRGNPVADARVTAFFGGVAIPVGEWFTTADGFFTSDPLGGDGPYEVEASADGWGKGVVAGVRPGAASVEIPLAPATSLGIILTGPFADTAPVSVRVDGLHRASLADSARSVQVGGVDPGPHTVTITATRAQGTPLAAEASISLPEFKHTVISMELRPTLTVRGRVLTWPDGAPIVGANVSSYTAALGADGNGFTIATTTDARGRFSLVGLLPGHGTIEVSTRAGTGRFSRAIPDAENYDIGDLAFSAQCADEAVVDMNHETGALIAPGSGEDSAELIEVLSVDGKSVAGLAPECLTTLLSADPPPAIVSRPAPMEEPP